MAAVPATPVPFVRSFWLDNNGNKLNGGLLFSYAGGTTTKQNTYTDATSGTANANPIVLDANGRADVFLDPTLAPYKFVLSPSTDTDPPTNAIWTEDNIWPAFNGGAPFTLTAAAVNETSLTLASAATVNIGGAKANYIFISGTTTITAFDTVQSGVERTLEFQGALTLTNNATSLILPGGSNIQTAAGDTAIFRSEGSGNWRCITYNKASGLSVVLPRSYLAGLTLSNDGSSPNTVLDIAAGQCIDSTNIFSIILGAFTKSTGGAWVSGTGNNGMGTGLTIANSTWYHVFAIINAGVADVYFDTSVTAANKPTSTTAFRRIGSFLTDGSARIVTFFQNGDDFIWNTYPALDVNTTNPGTSAVTVTLAGAPTGVRVRVLLNVVIVNTTPIASNALFSSLDVADTAPSETASPLGNAGLDSATANRPFSQVQVWTNTSQQIRYRLSASDGNVIVRVQVAGWTDLRGTRS